MTLRYSNAEGGHIQGLEFQSPAKSLPKQNQSSPDLRGQLGNWRWCAGKSMMLTVGHSIQVDPETYNHRYELCRCLRIIGNYMALAFQLSQQTGAPEAHCQVV